jgi:soluble lytic murein transglycosylase
VLNFYDKLTDEEKSSVDWRYWQARALEKLNKKEKAKNIYMQIADQREYYSFLAADRIGAHYQMNNRAIKVSTKALAKSRAFKIAKELYKIKEYSLMRRQWEWAIHDLNTDELLAAAKLAKKWRLNDRAIFTAARAKYYDDVKLRFPIAYKKLVRKYARLKHLPTSYVYGVIRQESAFMEDARSPAGARGLMQIMPSTGRLIARQQRRRGYRTYQLLDPKTNIDMGTFYLRDMLNRFNDNYAMATAAYNAGPGRPIKWRTGSELDADIWIENIPFNETRDYVKKVMMHKAIYHKRLRLKHQPLNKILLPVPGRG